MSFVVVPGDVNRVHLKKPFNLCIMVLHLYTMLILNFYCSHPKFMFGWVIYTLFNALMSFIWYIDCLPFLFLYGGIRDHRLIIEDNCLLIMEYCAFVGMP